jgi:hypothetical protein
LKRTGHPRLFAIALFVFGMSVWLSASDHIGQVTFNNLPVPGATVTATQGDKTVTTHADQEGRYRLPDLADGVWHVQVEMLGFEAAAQDVTVAEKTEPTIWQMKLQSFADITRGREVQQSAGAGVIPTAPPPVAAPGTPGIVPSRATNPATAANNAGNRPPGQAPPADLPDSNLANDGLLINGSVNNGAASPFAQAAAFGNNRRGPRSLYTGSMGAVLGNSALDARPYSFTGTPAAKPDYNDLQLLGTIGGPLRIPHVLRNGPNFFAGYQHNNDHNAATQSTLVPTPLERVGDFSQSRDAFGRPLSVIDPVTGLPFDGNAIPKERLSAQALSLLQYYPAPNIAPGGRFNYEIPIITATQQDNGQFRATQTLNARNNLQGTAAYSRTSVQANNVFNEPDTTVASAFDTSIVWNRRFSQVTQMRTRYQLTRTSNDTTPYFSNRTNVSGNAGITGNDQTPPNWGPPSLLFSSGIAGFGSAQFADNTTITNLATLEVLRTRGRHSLTIGGTVRWQHVNVLAQQDARGTFGFSGVATGSDLADFMLGLPNTSTIAFGNADKFLRSSGGDLYFNDDFRISPALTLNAGVRWEFDTPFAETGNRLSNLDVAPDFSAVSQVQPDGVGSITGQTFPSALISSDPHLIQPRLGVAWRPIPGSSLVVRAGYGVYRNTNTYQSIALLMAQQPPFSKALSLQSTRDELLTLANGFVGTPATALNTFAVNPDFRVSYAQNWQVSAQRDVPGSMTLIATYLGSSGSHLFQEFLPNTYAPGGINPCPTCPSGFTYLTSDGSSLRNAAQIEIRRRLRAGFTSTLRYTFAKATDNAAAFSGAALSGAAIAQDWTNLDAERARSNFDQRHLMTAQVQYTTGIGAAGGATLTGWQGALVKNWTVTAQLNTGTGLPTTPIYVTPIANTGVTGTVRASVTRVDEDRIPAGYYLNPLAFTAPAGGSWGDAGRNSVTGPPQFTLNGGITRTFLFGNRFNMDWRLDATNLLNVVTYSGINTLVGSSQFGLPNRANTMRKLQTTFRLRF